MAQIPAEVDQNVLNTVNFRQERYCVTHDWAVPYKIQAFFQLMCRDRAIGRIFCSSTATLHDS